MYGFFDYEFYERYYCIMLDMGIVSLVLCKLIFWGLMFLLGLLFCLFLFFLLLFCVMLFLCFVCNIIKEYSEVVVRR